MIKAGTYLLRGFSEGNQGMITSTSPSGRLIPLQVISAPNGGIFLKSYARVQAEMTVIFTVTSLAVIRKTIFRSKVPMHLPMSIHSGCGTISKTLRMFTHMLIRESYISDLEILTGTEMVISLLFQDISRVSMRRSQTKMTGLITGSQLNLRRLVLRSISSFIKDR